MNLKKLKKQLTVLSLCLMTTLQSGSAHPHNKEYVPFDDGIKRTEYDINSEYYVIQGICIVDDFIFVTAYNDIKSESSKVYIYDLDFNLIKETLLNNYSHVGGIAYDPINNNIWITDISGTISCYDKNDFLKFPSVRPKFERIDVSKGLVNIYGNTAVAYITYHNGYLYLGDFTIEDLATLKRYKIEGNGSINPGEYDSYGFYGFAQGLCFYNYNNEDYMLVSTSIGRLNKSKILLTKFDDNKKDFRNNQMIEFEMPNMLEQLSIHDDKLYTVYESNSFKYNTGAKHSGDILIEELDEKISDYINKL